MWSRFLRAFSSSLSAWRFASSPLQFVLYLLLLLLAPYLIYLLWGTVIFFTLLAIGSWALYRWYKKHTGTI